MQVPCKHQNRVRFLVGAPNDEEEPAGVGVRLITDEAGFDSQFLNQTLTESALLWVADTVKCLHEIRLMKDGWCRRRAVTPLPVMGAKFDSVLQPPIFWYIGKTA